MKEREKERDRERERKKERKREEEISVQYCKIDEERVKLQVEIDDS